MIYLSILTFLLAVIDMRLIQGFFSPPHHICKIAEGVMEYRRGNSGFEGCIEVCL